MMERLGRLGLLGRFDRAADGSPEEEGFTALRLFLSELLLTAGVQAAVEFLRRRDGETEVATRYRPFDAPEGRTEAVVENVLGFAPVVLGPAAAAAQATRAFRPSARSRTLTTVLNAAVIGTGASGLALSIRRASRGERRFSFTPLLFGYIGLLGVLLDREESAVQEEAERLRRRARLVERWVPKRRTRLDRIVVHV